MNTITNCGLDGLSRLISGQTLSVEPSRCQYWRITEDQCAEQVRLAFALYSRIPQGISRFQQECWADGVKCAVLLDRDSVREELEGMHERDRAVFQAGVDAVAAITVEA